MTAPSPTARPAPGPVLAAAVAGIVVLAFVGAPQSVNLVLLVGFDDPRVAGSQLLIGLAGAVGTGLAVLLVRQWTLVVVFGGLLVTLAYLVHPVAQQGLHVEVVTPDRPARTPDLVANSGWVALLVGGAAMVLVGVLGAASQLMRSGSRRTGVAVAGMAAASGYLGSLLVGWLPTGSPRVVVLVLALLVMAAGVVVGRASAGPGLPPRTVVLAWVAAVLPVVPTITVAITGVTTYQSVAGMVVCLLVLAGAVAACLLAGMAVLRAAVGAGLVLAAPVPLLVLILAGTAETTPLWAAAVPAFVVMAVVGAVMPRPGVLAGVILEAAVIAYLAVAGIDSEVGAWVVYALAAVAVTAAVAAGAGVADATLLPVLLPMVTAVGVGLRVVLDSIQLDPSISGLNALFGSGSLWLSVAMLVVGAGLLVAPRSRRVAVARV
ncbi:hypothetical protein [Labedaea rhizosphaerae]|uniref:hypothetical protein n=1 Tax=Labedaea rhizosphaerae TaxID=598644 RepID=UPI001061AEF6|nr:hypothetical protein [Labedaea rhizosphaerae]